MNTHNICACQKAGELIGGRRFATPPCLGTRERSGGLIEICYKWMRQFYYQTHFGSATMWATPDAPSPESPRARGSQGGLMKNRVKGLVVAALLIGMSGLARAAEAPAEIKLGTLYASSGRYASISMPVHSGLKLWIEQKNAEGGVFVKAFDKKIPVKLVAYDDQSNTGTAATLCNQLITQDKVDILVADSGSVLTSVAGPIARDNTMLLIH